MAVNFGIHPIVTIESVLPLDAKTLLVINDNNYPGVGGRDLNTDNSEFIKIRLDTVLDLAYSPIAKPQ